MKNEATSGGERSQAWFEGVQLARLDGSKAATRHQARFDVATPAPKLLQGCETLLREGGAQGRWYVAGISQVCGKAAHKRRPNDGKPACPGRQQGGEQI